MVEVFGEAGRHARFAIGTNALPRNCATEADAVFELSQVTDQGAEEDDKTRPKPQPLLRGDG